MAWLNAEETTLVSLSRENNLKLHVEQQVPVPAFTYDLSQVNGYCFS